MSDLNLSSNKALSSSSLKSLFFLLVLCVFLLYIFTYVHVSHSSSNVWSPSLHVSSLTTVDHVVFGISSNTWPVRKDYVNLWWKPEYKGCIFIEKDLLNKSYNHNAASHPPICYSEDTSHFRYTHKWGYRSAIRAARVVSETFAMNHSNVRWFVFGEDDTVFVPENLVKTLSKYDYNEWHYIGANSEAWEANDGFSHQMAFGGGGIALSYPLAKVLAKNLDSCLVRYPHLYGSDDRISSCLAELGVVLTHEVGFHQLDVRGDIFGLLTAHPLQPLVSLHHLDYVQPIFPNMTTNQALNHLFEAVKVDPARILQQSVCYDRWYTWTILISWGYAIQLFEHNIQLPDLLPVQHTFKPWNQGGSTYSNVYMFNTKKLPEDSCKRPTAFFLDNISSHSDETWSTYKRSVNESCLENKKLLKKLGHIKVFTQKLEFDVTKARRRQCCDILPSSTGKQVDVAVRECGGEELAYMHR